MEVLPSYEEATNAPDWLGLVAPTIPASQWRRCCLVNTHFYRQFAPRLWLDPLVTVRELGLHPNDDLAWYRYFISKHIKSVRPSTRGLVRSLDFRKFAQLASGLYSTEASERAISESFKDLPRIFPGLLCLLVDGHPELDPGSLIQNSGANLPRLSQSSLQLLDLAHCPTELSPKLFMSDYLRDLVYLDVCFTPGSVKTAVKSSLNPGCLPELRVLKVQGREMDDATASLLFRTFQRRLWTLDISHNKLTDASIDTLLSTCFSSISYHSDSHFQTEGKLVRPRDVGTTNHGPFVFVEESQFSATFGHPDSFMSDAPSYSRRADRQALQEWQVARLDGLESRKQDHADEIKRLLLRDAIAQSVTTSGELHQNVRASQSGITHIYLNGNSFTSTGVERLLRASSGRLEHFECDSPRFLPACVCARGVLPRSIQVFGLLGSSHLFRPVMSSNLRSLRIHHSLITNVPCLKADTFTARTAALLAETLFRERMAMAYPLTFIPNMNPRISSITLTGIPARSVGPLIDEIIRFLDLASAQQQAIDETRSMFRRGGPTVLTGLRHIRLELEPDHSAESPSMSGCANNNVDQLLDLASDNFGDSSSGLLDNYSWGITSRSRAPVAASPYPRSRDNEIVSPPSPNLPTFCHADVDGDYITHRVDSRDSWNRNVFSLPVWIGNGIPGPHAAVNEYMNNLRNPGLHTNVGPASPNHVAAGVPCGSYIFYAAWDSMIYPKQPPDAKSIATSLGQLKDVGAAIKAYRLRTRGTADHWTGKLELVRTDSTTRYLSSDYWR
ncbi:uncharacterized protein BCR38DRAFT_350282 [Pseudomassariella vexata]|uniref:Leucine rich repeat domain-containing protein n=1 Tax=Pseudomassariella vexata TaxID=1141098 RepID=A0A1Y2DKZ9_9PEZI|nr:uncharacterized protein BCR38DRAFT_350282 [Pseudomassariella vexata]ORY59950.1 hypothetical protein BCR38DRAFT_350282 [Pseudomassariella vexata]